MAKNDMTELDALLGELDMLAKGGAGGCDDCDDDADDALKKKGKKAAKHEEPDGDEGEDDGEPFGKSFDGVSFDAADDGAADDEMVTVDAGPLLKGLATRNRELVQQNRQQSAQLDRLTDVVTRLTKSVRDIGERPAGRLAVVSPLEKSLAARNGGKAVTREAMALHKRTVLAKALQANVDRTLSPQQVAEINICLNNNLPVPSDLAGAVDA